MVRPSSVIPHFVRREIPIYYDLTVTNVRRAITTNDPILICTQIKGALDK